MRLVLLLHALFLIPKFLLLAQSGCTDPLALNFDPNATTNDGSCVYPITQNPLSIQTPLASALNESSGLVFANGNVWTHNDGGSDPKIFQVDTLTGAILRTVTIGGATNVDWEDIAFGDNHFFIGDFGNNANGNRTDLKIYKIPFSGIPPGTEVTVLDNQVEVINFSYEDQTNFDPTGSNNTSFDCEAMIWKGDSLHLFTKDWINNTTTHYVLPATAGTYQALKRETFDVEGLITAADISNQGLILLLGYSLTTGTAFYWQLWDYAGEQFFSGNKRLIGLGSVFTLGQVEGLCFRRPRSGYVSNEQLVGVIPPRLYSFEIGFDHLTSGTKVSFGNDQSFCDRMPNPMASDLNPELFDELPAKHRAEIWDNQGRLIWQIEGQVKSNPQQLPAGMYHLLVRNALGTPVCIRKLFVP